jgi:hypothetical protein
MAATQHRRKLRIGRVKDALLFPFKNIMALLRLGLGPGAIAAALSYAIVTGYPIENADLRNPEAAERVMLSLLPVLIVTSLLSTLAMSIYAVGIHRLIIRGEQSDWVLFRFGRYEVAYFGAMLLFYAAYFLEQSALEFIVSQAFGGFGQPGRPAPAGVDASVLGMLTQPFTAIAVILALTGVLIWVHLRLALLFPHAAVTGTIAPLVSWRAMAGNSLRMLGALILLGLGAIVVWLVLGSTTLFAVSGFLLSAGGRADDVAGMVRTIAAVGVAVMPAIAILIAITVAFMSYVYKDLVEDGGQEAQPGIGNQPALG